ncbi:MAG: winged helix-turn-helix domain-containing protein [Chitinophagaceae bacterium]
MENSIFTLNDKFSVDASLNLLTNTETGLQTRLEPRLIEILCILAVNEGKMVSRETLISEVWDNYGGAEDGLNQAISFLRKALCDADKKIIQTVPKKGYILHASISNNLLIKKTEPAKKKTSTRQVYAFAVLGGLFILIAIVLFTSGKNKIPEKIEKRPNTVLQQDAVVSKNWRGKYYKLLVGENEKITLFENDIQIADSSLHNYEIIIQELKDKLTAEQDAKR